MKFEEFQSSKLLTALRSETALTDREKHMIGIAVTATRGCINCTGSRIMKAKEAGIPNASVLAAVDLAAAVNAGVTLAIAIQGANLFGESKEIAVENCADGVCTVGVQ